MNETLIFIKIRSVFKNIETEIEMKKVLRLKLKWKSIDTEIKMKKYWPWN